MSEVKNPVSIYTESNPNPNSLKFVANLMLVPEGQSYDFPDKESAKNAPLAEQLFDMPFVDRVFYMNNFVTVTKKENFDWIEIKEPLKEFIRKHIENAQPLLTEEHKEETPNNQVQSEDSEMDERIKTILEEYIKPAVEMDGGAIQYHSFHEGTVKVLLQGSCSGCPSSMVTLKAGIENLLKSMVPEVKTVEAEEI